MKRTLSVLSEKWFFPSTFFQQPTLRDHSDFAARRRHWGLFGVYPQRLGEVRYGSVPIPFVMNE
jgi:hypothetical protein